MSVNFSIEDYPFLPTIGQGGIIGVQQGVISSVPADGSSFPTLTFPTPFSSQPSVSADSNTTTQVNEMLTIGFFNFLTNSSGQYVSCQVSVTGGQPGTTITVGWIASNAG